MKTSSTFGIVVAVLAAVLTVSAASAQESKAPATDQMMQGEGAMPGNTTGDDMSGMPTMMPMMQMMQMMQMMGAMMEQCTEMMAAMTDHMGTAPQTKEDNG
tara:strand:+ start:5322 stop:5624 length:303 start_codon:yes stop_codon:yes gene_type:complete